MEDRLKQLQEAHRDFGPASQHFLSSKFFELIDMFNIWLHRRLLKTVCPLLTALQDSLWPEAQEFPLPSYYLPLCLFPGVFHLHSSADILTGVLSLGVAAVSCWVMTASFFAFFSVLCLLQGLTCGCTFFVFLTTSGHPMLPRSLALVPCLLGWHKGSAAWILGC